MGAPQNIQVAVTETNPIIIMDSDCHEANVLELHLLSWQF